MTVCEGARGAGRGVMPCFEAQPPRALRMQTGSGDGEATVHDRSVRVAVVAVEAAREAYRPGRAARVLHRGQLVHARPKQLEVVDRREIGDPDRVAAWLQL